MTSINIKTEIEGPLIIQSEWWDYGQEDYLFRNIVDTVRRQVIDTSEKQVRDALIKMGWTPPEEKVELDFTLKQPRGVYK